MSDPEDAVPEELSRTSTSLLRMVRARDEAGWVRLVDQYGPKIHRWCFRAGLQEADAANVSQEVFSAIAQGMKRFQHDGEDRRLRKWVRSITVNKIRDHWRRRTSSARVIGGSSWQQRVDELADVESRPDPVEDLDRLTQALAVLPSLVSERDWAIFVQLVVDERTASDVAHDFGITANLVRAIRSRLLEQLCDFETAAAAMCES